MTTTGRYTTNGKQTASAARNVLGGPLEIVRREDLLRHAVDVSGSVL